MRIPPVVAESGATRRRLFVLQPSSTAARANRAITADTESSGPPR
jgi:hypothetical protein